MNGRARARAGRECAAHLELEQAVRVVFVELFRIRTQVLLGHREEREPVNVGPTLDHVQLPLDHLRRAAVGEQRAQAERADDARHGGGCANFLSGQPPPARPALTVPLVVKACAR